MTDTAPRLPQFADPPTPAQLDALLGARPVTLTLGGTIERRLHSAAHRLERESRKRLDPLEPAQALDAVANRLLEHALELDEQEHGLHADPYTGRLSAVAPFAPLPPAPSPRQRQARFDRIAFAIFAFVALVLFAVLFLFA